MKEQTEDLRLERLLSMDKPSLYALAILATKTLEQEGKVLFSVDLLGRIQIMPPATFELKSRPKIEKEELDKLPIELAVDLMVTQEDREEDIIMYIKSREES